MKLKGQSKLTTIPMAFAIVAVAPLILAADNPLAGCLGFDLCGELKAEISACMDDYCSGAAGTPLCECWDQGEDINVNTCTCTPFDWDSTCVALEYDANNFDCDLLLSQFENFGPCE